MYKEEVKIKAKNFLLAHDCAFAQQSARKPTEIQTFFKFFNESKTVLNCCKYL